MLSNDNLKPGFQPPFFTVVITTYARAILVPGAIRSLLAQIEDDWEAFIIDDGSTDDTGKIIDLLIRDEPRIQYYYQKNQGANAARNMGIKLAEGQYITFLDSDDEYLPEHLATRKQFLQKHPDTLLLHGGLKVIGNAWVPDWKNYGKLIHLSKCVVGGTFFIRRSLANQLNGFSEIPMGSDTDLLERAKSMGAAIAHTDIPTYIYHRENPDSVTNDFFKNQNNRSYP